VQPIETAKILIADDEPANVLLLQRLLENSGFAQIATETDSRKLFDRFDTFAPDILLLDIQMPHLDGFAIMQGVAERLSEEDYFPILVLTADTTADTKRRALSAGARDFVTKPFDAVEVVLRVRNLLQIRFLHNRLRRQNEWLEAEVRSRTRALEEAQIEVLDRLGLVTEYRDDATGAHTRRVGSLASRVALAAGLDADEADMIRLAAPLHDLGKVAIPDSILLKPGRLLPEEFALIQQHTTIGVRILSGSRSRLLRLAEEIALTHHERWDGSGYPHGLRGDAIPLSGRIIAVVDVYDALTHRRPYKEAWPAHEAEAEIERLSGTHFDPQVVRAFRKALAEERREEELPLAA
jgi:putative two-component system response regulator